MVLKPGEVNNWASLPFLVANFASIFALSLVLLDRGYTTFVSSRKFAEWLLIRQVPTIDCQNQRRCAFSACLAIEQGN